MKNQIKPAKICQKTREITGKALLVVLKKIWRTHFSEKQLKDLWLKELRKNKNLFPLGWYSPPPDGISILIASENNHKRLDYDSLRKKENWPREDIFFNSQTGLVFVYASPVDKKSGIFGDLGMTLYAGKNQKIIEHLKRVYQINHQVVKLIKPGIEVKDVYRQTINFLKKAGLVNKVASVTDSAGTNIGHSVPGTIRSYTQKELKIIQGNDWFKACQIISQKRIFLNQEENYIFKADDCFTLEPSLIDPQNPQLPRVLFHTIMVIKKDKAVLLENFDEIFHATGMDYML